jgi:hypothetical protein
VRKYLMVDAVVRALLAGDARVSRG